MATRRKARRKRKRQKRRNKRKKRRRIALSTHIWKSILKASRPSQCNKLRRAVPEQFQSSSRAVPEQFQSSFRAIPGQFQSSRFGVTEVAPKVAPRRPVGNAVSEQPHWNGPLWFIHLEFFLVVVLVAVVVVVVVVSPSTFRHCFIIYTDVSSWTNRHFVRPLRAEIRLTIRSIVAALSLLFFFFKCHSSPSFQKKKMKSWKLLPIFFFFYRMLWIFLSPPVHK